MRFHFFANAEGTVGIFYVRYIQTFDTADENMFFPWSMFIFSSSVISAMMFVISSSCCVRGLTFSLVGLHAEKHPPMQISNDNVECFMV